MTTQQSARFPIHEVAVGYLLSILVADFLLIFGGQAFAGIILHSAIVISLVVWASTFGDEENARTLTALTLYSILRLIATISPLRSLPIESQELALSIAMLTVGFIYLNVNNMTLSDIGLKLNFNLTQFSIALTGIGIGFLFHLIAPEPIQTELAIPIAIEFFVSFVEVMLFHGILLTTVSKTLGKFPGILFTSIYYVALFMVLPAPVVAIQLIVNILYGTARIRTDNLMGIIVGQAIARVIYIFLAPILFSGLL